MFEHHVVCHRCGKKEAILLTELPPDPPSGWMALHVASPGLDVKCLVPSLHIHTFCSWQCLAEHVTYVAGHPKAQSSPQSDASAPAERQGPESGPDALELSKIRQDRIIEMVKAREARSKALELPRPNALGLSQIRLGHAAGHTDMAIHDLIDVIENLEARVKALESNLTE